MEGESSSSKEKNNNDIVAVAAAAGSTNEQTGDKVSSTRSIDKKAERNKKSIDKKVDGNKKKLSTDKQKEDKVSNTSSIDKKEDSNKKLSTDEQTEGKEVNPSSIDQKTEGNKNLSTDEQSEDKDLNTSLIDEKPEDNEKKSSTDEQSEDKEVNTSSIDEKTEDNEKKLSTDEQPEDKEGNSSLVDETADGEDKKSPTDEQPENKEGNSSSITEEVEGKEYNCSINEQQTDGHPSFTAENEEDEVNLSNPAEELMEATATMRTCIDEDDDTDKDNVNYSTVQAAAWFPNENPDVYDEAEESDNGIVQLGMEFGQGDLILEEIIPIDGGEGDMFVTAMNFDTATDFVVNETREEIRETDEVVVEDGDGEGRRSSSPFLFPRIVAKDPSANFNFKNRNLMSPGSASTSSMRSGVQSNVQNLTDLIYKLGRQNGAWGVFEVEDYTLTKLNSIANLLTVMDKTLVKKATRSERYKNVKGLCIYFALEERKKIRCELLGVLELMAMKDETAAAVMMQSDLPVDVIKALQMEHLRFGQEKHLLAYCSFLAFLLNTGYPLQVDHLERIDCAFAWSLLEIIEGRPYWNNLQLRNAAVDTLLAFNSQYELDDLYSSGVISAIAEKLEDDEGEYLKQRLLFLLLEKKVPTFRKMKIFMFSANTDMVVKLLCEIFSCDETIPFFMDSDFDVIVAGLCCYIPQLDAGDERRTMALRLLRCILRSINYHHPGLNSMNQMLNDILMEKDEESYDDQKISMKMTKEMEHCKLHATF